MPDKQIDVLVKAILDSKQFQKGVAKMKGSANAGAKSVGASFGKIKAKALGIVTGIVAGVAAFGKFISVSKVFEKAIADVAAVSDGTRKQLERLAREAGVRTVFTATEAAKALLILAKAGIDVRKSQELLIPTLNLATAADLDLNTATNILLGQMQTFGIELGRSTEVVDILVKGTNSATTTMEELGFALKFVGPTARLAGASLEDTTAILGAMAKGNIKGTLAGTQLRQSFNNLIKPTAEARRVLEKYGVSMNEVRELLPTPIKLFERLNEVNLDNTDALTLFGARAGGVSQIVRNQIPLIKELREKLADAGGTAEDIAAKKLDTLDGQLRLVGSAFQEVTLAIQGEGGIIGSLKGMATSLRDVLVDFAKFVETKQGIQAITAAFGVLKVFFKSVFLVIRTQINFGIFGVKLFITAIKTLINVAKLVAKGDIGDAFKEIGKGAVESAKLTVDLAKAQAGLFIDIGKDIVDTTKAIINAQDKVKASFEKGDKDILESGEETTARLLSFWENLSDKRKELIKAGADAVFGIEKELFDLLQSLRDEELADTLSKIDQEKMARLEAAGSATTALKEFNEQQTADKLTALTKEVADAKAAGDEEAANEAQLQIDELTLEKAAATEKEAIDKEFAEKKRKAQNKAAQKDHDAAVAQGFIDAAVGALKGLITPPVPNFGLAAIAGGAGLVATKFIASQPVPKRARGGRLNQGQSALVGEQGAELFIPDAGGSIVSNEALRGLNFGTATGSTAQDNRSFSESNDNNSKTFNFIGVRDISTARNQLLRTEGSEAF